MIEEGRDCTRTASATFDFARAVDKKWPDITEPAEDNWRKDHAVDV